MGNQIYVTTELIVDEGSICYERNIIGNSVVNIISLDVTLLSYIDEYRILLQLRTTMAICE